MQVIKQGYLLKRSSSLRTDWKRKFFVLDSHGSMYYYRNNGNKSMVRVHRPLLFPSSNPWETFIEFLFVSNVEFFFCHSHPQGSQHHYSGSSDHTGVFGRFRARHNRSASLTEGSLGYKTIDLRTCLIKLDAEDMDLRLCFRIISPQKTYTLQAPTLLSISMIPSTQNANRKYSLNWSGWKWSR